MEKSKFYYDWDSSLGAIRGQVVLAPNGKEVVKFLGVPYAEQPVGKLRFKPLQPLSLPLGTKESPFLALNYGPCSLQNTELLWATSLPVGEDCIYLNIYTPVENMGNTKRRVFFNIHGGSFYFNSGSEPEFDMTNFVARHDCVGVSINYRLGLLGFLSMPPVIEDNLGLKDQQVALKWVHQHIRSFGGDPEKITLYGCSAGSASCQFHTLNRESIDLFERAILSSGFLNKCWGYTTPENQRERVKFTLEQLKCPSTLTPEETLQYLMSLDGKVFSDVIDAFGFKPLTTNYPCPVSTFCEDKSSLVPLKKKPLLVGVTTGEGNFMPEVLEVGFDPINGLTSEAKQVSKLEAERNFVYPLRILCEHITASSDYPLFAYLYDYETKTRGKTAFLAGNYPQSRGACHYTDIPFLMNLFCASSQHIPHATETDIVVNEAMAGIVEKFMSQEVEKIGLPVFGKGSPKVSRITHAGNNIEENDFKNL